MWRHRCHCGQFEDRLAPGSYFASQVACVQNDLAFAMRPDQADSYVIDRAISPDLDQATSRDVLISTPAAPHLFQASGLDDFTTPFTLDEAAFADLYAQQPPAPSAPAGASPSISAAWADSGGSQVMATWSGTNEMAGSTFVAGPAFDAPTGAQGFVPASSRAPSQALPHSSGHGGLTSAGRVSSTQPAMFAHAVAPPALLAPHSGGAGHSTLPAPALPTSPFIVSHVGPNVVPLLFSSTADDPAMKLVQVADNAQGQDPMTQAYSAGGVRYGDGTVQLTQPDLSSTGFASAWGQTRTWTNNSAYLGGTTSTNANGNGWIDSQNLYLLQQNSGKETDVIASGTDAFVFDLRNGVWTPRYFLQNSLTDNTTTHQFTLGDNTGRTVVFMDFSAGVPTGEQGTFVSLTDSYGNQVSVVSHTSSGQIQEVQSSSTQGSTTVTESYLNTYIASGTNAGLLQNEQLRRELNGGSWVVAQHVAYTYYDGTTSYGNAGDLQTATVEDGSGGALGTSYYRWYTSTGSGGYIHGLEYSFDARSYARLAAAVSNPLTASNATVAPYAQDYFQYDSSQRVTEEVVQGAGSSLGTTNVGLGTYTYSYTTSANATGYNSWTTEVVTGLPDGSTDTTFTNAYGEVMLQDHYDPASGLHWDSFNEYDSAGRIIVSAAPSAVTGYNSTYADLLDYSNGSYFYLSNTSGLITTDTYYSTTTAGETTAGGVAGYLEQTAVQQGQNGTPVVQDSTQYFLHTANGESVAPVANDTVYRNTNQTGGETTSYVYTWFSGTTQMQSEQVSLPVVSSAQNGPGTADVSVTFFDSLGRTTWTKDADGYINYDAYDPATNALTTQIVDVNTNDTGEFTGLPTGWATPSGGGLNLITTDQVDTLGRTVKETDPAGNVTYTVYDDPDHEIRTYVGWNTTTNLPTGPTQVTRTDYAGSYTEVLTMSATPHLTNGVPDGTEAISNLQTFTRTYANSAGQDVRTDPYFNLVGLTYSTAANLGTLNTNYYESTQDYDSRGWLTRQVSATGTITRTVHDSLSRNISIWVGTNDTPASGQWSPTNNTSPANMVQTVGYQYDSCGVGDGNMTQETDYPGGTQANRVTQFWFDWRDRQVARKSGVQASESDGTHRPILFDTYDNLGEVTEEQRYDGDGVTITVTSGVPQAPSASLLRAQTVTAYDDQQRPYQRFVYEVNQSTGAVSTTALTTNDFYDHRGDQIEESQPGGEVTKDQYDGAGRDIEHYTTDGAGGTSWTAAASVASDHVLEQTDTQFDADGNSILVTHRLRDHNTTQTGALGNETTSPEARVYYVAYYYDAANRPTATVNVGTNGGGAYTRPGTVPADSSTVLVSAQTYNAAGWVQDVIDPRGLDTRTTQDALGETTQTIEDYTNGTPTAETNKTVNLTYDGDGHQLSLQVVEPGGASETTQWVYGVTTAGGSTINSKDILATVEYPDPTTGSPSTAYEETYTVDALGENLTYSDRAGNVHSYSYDILGRQIADAITTLASGFDNSVLRIGTTYNALGDAYQVTMYNAASGGSIVNQVENIDNGLDQLVQQYQSHSGAVVPGTTPSVQYAYTEMSGGQNNSRLVSMTYPNGRVLDYNYNTGLDSSISRLSSISDTSATLESYLYLGLDTVVERDHPQPGVNMTYISQTGSTGDAGDQYTGLDRFGRVTEVNWVNTSTHTSTDDFQYGYDQDGNVLYKNNLLDAPMSELYHASGAGNGYDGLNQLTNFERGTLSASQQGGQLDTVANPSTTVSWALDALGDFTSVTQDGAQTNRTNNQQNELTAVGSSSLTYDKNGNTLTDNSGNSYEYNAWNQTVSVSNGGQTIAAYLVDGLGHRVRENESGTLTDVYFSAQWQAVEEDVSGAMTNQYVWSPVYVNALIERDTPTQRLYAQDDANWNVTALVNISGTVLERYICDPYGTVVYLTGGWGSRSGSNYAWHYLFQGGRLDAGTGLYGFERRDLSTMLGRWDTPDPLRDKAGDSNLYRFVGDGPLVGTDPSGLLNDPSFYPRPTVPHGDIVQLTHHPAVSLVFMAYEPDACSDPGMAAAVGAIFDAAFEEIDVADDVIIHHWDQVAASDDPDVRTLLRYRSTVGGIINQLHTAGQYGKSIPVFGKPSENYVFDDKYGHFKAAATTTGHYDDSMWEFLWAATPHIDLYNPYYTTTPAIQTMYIVHEFSHYFAHTNDTRGSDDPKSAYTLATFVIPALDRIAARFHDAPIDYRRGWVAPDPGGTDG